MGIALFQKISNCLIKELLAAGNWEHPAVNILRAGGRMIIIENQILLNSNQIIFIPFKINSVYFWGK